MNRVLRRNLRYYNTLTPFHVIKYKGIQYTTCRDFKHISRHKGLRQVIHNPDDSSRFMALETPNPFKSQTEVMYYEVPSTEENRLDLIAYKFLGSAQYSWIIAYFNGIEDGFTVNEGQRLAIPKSISSLFNKGEVLASVSPYALNLGSE